MIILVVIIGAKYWRMDQVKFFKGYVPQISLEALFEYFVSYIDLSPDENYEGSTSPREKT